MIKNLELSPSVSILIAGVLIAGAIVFVNLNANAAPAPAGDGTLPGNTKVAAPSADDHIIGSPTAPIVLIEYLDFQCVYCSMVHPTLKRIVEESDGQVAWVMRHLPLESIHPEARPAGLAAECIAEQLGQAGWWAFADDMMANQEGMGTARYLGRHDTDALRALR
ncbi:MAG: thioredoxin domain-containing protein, partial [Patescibacteria group bacterium]